MLIHSLQAEELINIVAGKTNTNMVNVDKVLQSGQQQMLSFIGIQKVLLLVSQQSVYDEEK